MAGVCILAVTVVISACLIQVVIGSCSQGTFGDSCSYTCHCRQSCNLTTGVCGGVCDRGWVGGQGGTCQKENVALEKDAASPTRLWTPVWSADKAVDGNSDQDVYKDFCFNSADNVRSSWTVDLGDDYRIHDVRIYHQKNHLNRIRTAALYLSNTNITPSVPCYTFPSNTSVTGNGIYNVVCDGIGRYFTITDPTHLNLCEVEIYVCSPRVFGDSCNQFCHCLQATCDPVSGVCPGDCRPGWQGDRCDTECDADYYGVNCMDICTNRKCSDDNSSCDRYNGSCDKGCLPGWRGVDCTQECNNGIYGTDCNMTCSERKCAGDSSCDHVRGKCTSGCVSGWKGEDCTTASLPQQNNQVGSEEILIPAVTVTTIVVSVAAAVAVGVVIWRRRRRSSLQESDSHDYYNTSHLSKVPTKQSQDNDETHLEDRTYDGLSVMSREIKGPGETYCTINTEKPDLEGGESGEVAETTDRDIYEPTEPRTYETLDSTSRDMTGEYSELGRIA